MYCIMEVSGWKFNCPALLMEIRRDVIFLITQTFTSKPLTDSYSCSSLNYLWLTGRATGNQCEADNPDNKTFNIQNSLNSEYFNSMWKRKWTYRHPNHGGQSSLCFARVFRGVVHWHGNVINDWSAWKALFHLCEKKEESLLAQIHLFEKEIMQIKMTFANQNQVIFNFSDPTETSQTEKQQHS